jgi:hypothetical protein
MKTSATYGRRGSGSSASRALSFALASRLQTVTERLGSTMWDMTWKASDTPSGRYLPRLVVSARRTSANDFSSWPTPVANDDNKSVAAHLAMKARMGGGRKAITSLQVMAKTVLAPWLTPSANEDAAGRYGANMQQMLGNQVKLAQPAAFGLDANGSLVQTGNAAPLNPEHSRWLMGLPAAWSSCAPTATRSLRRSQRSSSAPIDKSGGQHE